MKKWAHGSLFVVVALTVCLPASAPLAQKMYRCGNEYQDHPCGGGKEGKDISVGGASRKTSNPPSAAPAGAAASPVCPQRGAESQKIVWAREAGETEEKMLSSERDPGRRKLIAGVYRIRGTAAEVRTRIEAECEVEMAENAKALALHEAMVRAGAVPAVQQVAPVDPGAEERKAAAATAELKQRDAASKKARCTDLATNAESLRAQERSGGSIESMDSLRRQRARTEDDLRKLGC
jgi:hypothetical protein